MTSTFHLLMVEDNPGDVELTREALSEMFARQADGLVEGSAVSEDSLSAVNTHLRVVERYWAEQIRYIY